MEGTVKCEKEETKWICNRKTKNEEEEAREKKKRK